MSSGRIVFTKARSEDLQTMAAIEQEFFGDYDKSFDVSFFEKWFAHNPDMFFVIRDETNAVLGFVILTPVTEKLYTRLISGDVFDFFDFSEEDVLASMNSDYYYVSDICITRKVKISSLGATINIIGGMIEILSEKAKYVTACPVTKEGAGLCKTIGMKKVAESEHNGQSYTICQLDVTKGIVDRFRRLTQRVNKVK